MKQVLPRLVRPQTPGCPLYESCSSTEFLLQSRTESAADSHTGAFTTPEQRYGDRNAFLLLNRKQKQRVS